MREATFVTGSFFFWAGVGGRGTSKEMCSIADSENFRLQLGIEVKTSLAVKRGSWFS